MRRASQSALRTRRLSRRQACEIIRLGTSSTWQPVTCPPKSEKAAPRPPPPLPGQPGKGGGAPGAYFSLFDGWLEGRQVELVPNERISQAWRFTDWEPGVYSMVRFTLADENGATKMVVDQDGVPDDVHEHVRTNWHGFYFEPFVKHFAGLPGSKP